MSSGTQSTTRFGGIVLQLLGGMDVSEKPPEHGYEDRPRFLTNRDF